MRNQNLGRRTNNLAEVLSIGAISSVILFASFYFPRVHDSGISKANQEIYRIAKGAYSSLDQAPWHFLSP